MLSMLLNPHQAGSHCHNGATRFPASSSSRSSSSSFQPARAPQPTWWGRGGKANWIESRCLQIKWFKIAGRCSSLTWNNINRFDFFPAFSPIAGLVLCSCCFASRNLCIYMFFFFCFCCFCSTSLPALGWSWTPIVVFVWAAFGHSFGVAAFSRGIRPTVATGEAAWMRLGHKDWVYRRGLRTAAESADKWWQTKRTKEVRGNENQSRIFNILLTKSTDAGILWKCPFVGA